MALWARYCAWSLCYHSGNHLIILYLSIHAQPTIRIPHPTQSIPKKWYCELPGTWYVYHCSGDYFCMCVKISHPRVYVRCYSELSIAHGLFLTIMSSNHRRLHVYECRSSPFKILYNIYRHHFQERGTFCIHMNTLLSDSHHYGNKDTSYYIDACFFSVEGVGKWNFNGYKHTHTQTKHTMSSKMFPIILRDHLQYPHVSHAE